MAGQPVQRHRAYPVIDRVRLQALQWCALQQPASQGGQLAQRVGVIEGQQVRAPDLPRFPGHLAQPRGNLRGGWRGEARAGQQQRQRVDVVAGGPASHQGRLHRRGAAAHEGVVHGLAGRGQAADEERRQLRLEAGPVADFMDAVGLALSGGPELVDEIRDAALGDFVGRGTEPGEGTHLPQKIPRHLFGRFAVEQRQGAAGGPPRRVGQRQCGSAHTQRPRSCSQWPGTHSCHCGRRGT